LKNAPAVIYKKLLTAFGPQGWWPLYSVAKGRCVYPPLVYLPPDENGRFEICTGALLTQNTAWTNVEKALARLKAENMLSARRLAAAPEGEIAGLIRSSGYFMQKARKLKIFSRHLLQRHPEGIEKWFSGPLESVRAELLSVWGIGPETADSMLLYAGGRPTFVVDAYTRRLLSRLGFAEARAYDEARNLYMRLLPADYKIYNEYHALIVELGKRHCAKTPRCANCPLSAACPKEKI